MGHRLLSASVVGLLTLTAVLGVAACAVDPLAPAVIEGIVVDVDRRPVAGASVSIIVEDGPPGLLDLTVTTGADGRFTIPLAATPDLQAAPAERGGEVAFSLSAVLPDGTFSGGWLFSRTPTGSGWAGPTPRVILSREGSEVEP